MKINQKGISFVLIILILAIIVIGGALIYKKQVTDKDLAPNYGYPPYESPVPTPTLRPTPQDPKFTEIDTSSWNEYTNFSDIYTFKYPSDWYINETPKVDKYHAKGNAAFQNKSFEELPETAREVNNFTPPLDLVFGEIQISSVYRSTDQYATEENFYNIERGNYWYWSLSSYDGSYVFKPEELKLNNYRIMFQKTFPIKYFSYGPYNLDSHDADWIKSDYWIWLGDKNKDESQLIHLAIYSNLKNPNRDREINKFNQLLATLKINSSKL